MSEQYTPLEEDTTYHMASAAPSSPIGSIYSVPLNSDLSPKTVRMTAPFSRPPTSMSHYDETTPFTYVPGPGHIPDPRPEALHGLPASNVPSTSQFISEHNTQEYL